MLEVIPQFARDFDSCGTGAGDEDAACGRQGGVEGAPRGAELGRGEASGGRET